jgi:phosphohistidine phosphatase
MKKIILMRHAQAEQSADAERDYDRQLTAEGRNMATRTAVVLNHAQLRPDRIICSAATRTRQTADLVASVTEFFGVTELVEDLYLAESSRLASSIPEYGSQEDKILLLVGHNPGIADLIGILSAEAHSVPPSTAAVFQVPIDDWSQFASTNPADFRLTKMIRRGEIVV